MKHKVAKYNRDKTQQSVYEAVIREINNITAEDWSRAIGNYFCEKSCEAARSPVISFCIINWGFLVLEIKIEVQIKIKATSKSRMW